MALKPEELTYFCKFDNATGKRIASYIKELQEVPADVTEVSYEDFMKYISDNNYIYDFTNKTIKYVDVADSRTYEDLVEYAQKLINNCVANAIATGYGMRVDGAYYTFDCSIEDQINLQAMYTESLVDKEGTWVVRAEQAGHDYKVKVTLNADQVADLVKTQQSHIKTIRNLGFNNKAYVTGARTVDELRAFIAAIESSGKLKNY